ncbi:MAG: hypothetical protein H7A49_06435 [Akkermansiaceae bacterium]|nr:hypothetical protein [Akkermansiaceae bacterium]MCP5543528.1 hypothetical protein [Akkermansiaceae bacterium]
MKTDRTIQAAIGAALLALVPATQAQDATAAPANLIKNGDMETIAAEWPANWPKPKEGGSLEEEKGNHFIRLKSPEPDKMILLYHQIPIPAGTKKIELKWKQRASDLKAGTEAWFDARVMLEFRNDEKQKVGKAPSAPYVRKDTAGWEERSVTAEVPEGATWFVFMPSLFRVASGTLDIDDFSLTVVEP